MAIKREVLFLPDLLLRFPTEEHNKLLADYFIV